MMGAFSQWWNGKPAPPQCLDQYPKHCIHHDGAHYISTPHATCREFCVLMRVSHCCRCDYKKYEEIHNER
jgi:hypothetical protein